MTRGRPKGSIPAHYCPVRDPAAFRALMELLVTKLAAPGARGGVLRDLAWRLDVSPALIHRYRRAAPAAITPELFAALERAPMMTGQDAPFPFDEYFALLERAVDGENAEGAAPPHTDFAWLPGDDDAGTLEAELGVTMHNMRRTGRLSTLRVSALPVDRWLHCKPTDAEIIGRTLERMDTRRMLTRRTPAGGVLILLQAL